jgi:biopolymer transport protein ExbB
VKNLVFIPILVASVVVSWFIWNNSPEYIKQGGPLLVIGLTCFFLLVTFCIERLVVLTRAGGRGNVPGFLRVLKQALDSGDVPGAIDACKRQGGCLANVVGAGLERYADLRGTATDRKEMLAETRQAIQIATALESPHLEKNLSAFSTIASIATMIGLLGTTIGMIRSFQAMSHAGAPDATQLALGISEALVNTALGLTTAIIAIVLYNYFTNRVDQFNNEVEETSWAVLELLKQRKEP